MKKVDQVEVKSRTDYQRLERVGRRREQWEGVESLVSGYNVRVGGINPHVLLHSTMGIVNNNDALHISK